MPPPYGLLRIILFGLNWIYSGPNKKLWKYLRKREWDIYTIGKRDRLRLSQPRPVSFRIKVKCVALEDMTQGVRPI